MRNTGETKVRTALFARGGKIARGEGERRINHQTGIE